MSSVATPDTQSQTALAPEPDPSAASDTAPDAASTSPDPGNIAPAAGYTAAWQRRLFSCHDSMPDDWEQEMADADVLTGYGNAEVEGQVAAVVANWVQTGKAAAGVVPLCPSGVDGWLAFLLLVTRSLAVVPVEQVPAVNDACHPAAVVHLQAGHEHAETATAEDRERWVARRLCDHGPRGCCLLAVALPAPLRPAACACRVVDCPGCTVVADVLRWVRRRQWHRIGAPRPRT